MTCAPFVSFGILLCCLLSNFPVSHGVTCNVDIKCFGFTGVPGNSGHLIVNENTLATWEAPDTLRRRKRQVALATGWHIFSLASTCENITDRLETTHSEVTADNFTSTLTNFIRAQPQGSWIVGCSAGGVDPEFGTEDLQLQSLNTIRALGIDPNITNSIEGYSSTLLLSESSIAFTAQKGFPETATWNIVETVEDNFLNSSINIDWYCGIPPMAGTELFSHGTYSGATAKNIHMVMNSPVQGSNCVLRGWEFIATEDAEGGSVNVGIVRGDGASMEDVFTQQIDITSSTSDRQFVCSSASFTAQQGDKYGIWYDTPGSGSGVIRSEEQPDTMGLYPYPCGRTMTSIDGDGVVIGSGNSFPPASTTLTHQSMAMRPIFDPEFVLSCDCTTDSNCSANDDAMMCVNSKCACQDGFSFNRWKNRCILSDSLTSAATATLSNVDSGEASNIIDDNLSGSLYDGTCATTLQEARPYVLIDLNLYADIYAVKITTPSPASSYLEVVFNDQSVFRIGSLVEMQLSTILPAGKTASDISLFRSQGKVPWIIYASDSGEPEIDIIIDTPNVDSFLDITGTATGIRMIDELGTLLDTATGECLHLDANSNQVVFSSACTSLFFVESDNQLYEFTTYDPIGNNNGRLELSEDLVYFITEDTNADGSGNFDLADLEDGAIIRRNSGECIIRSGNTAQFGSGTTGPDCVTFRLQKKYKVHTQTWEASEFTIDGYSCHQDARVLDESYNVRPCVEVISNEPSTISTPDIFYADMDQVLFLNQDPSFTNWCRNFNSRVFYQASETGLHDFRIGVANSYDEGAPINENSFATCASYVGNVASGTPLLVNCTENYEGRYIAIYIPHHLTDDRILLCDVQVFGKTADPCNANNGGCEHNCIPGQLPGETQCECFSDEYILHVDGTCVDIDECAGADICNNDVHATCVNDEPGFHCVCDPSVDNVIQFDANLGRCSVPQNERNRDIEDNLCSYNNGGCQEICVPGLDPYSFSCQCDESEAEKELAPDGTSCQLVDACTTSTDCDNDALASCHDAPFGYNCICMDQDLGVFWNDTVTMCSTGGDTNTLCDFQGTCLHVCVPSTPATNVRNYTCACNTGYRLNADGRTCDDINECIESPNICNNGIVPGTCTNIQGSFSCSCQQTGYIFASQAQGCQDINECDLNNGGCAHTCVNTIGGSQCQCRSGFTTNDVGITCTDVNECTRAEDNNCDQICRNTIGSYTCDCEDGWIWDEQQDTCVDIHECDSNNGGCQHVCREIEGGFECDCSTGYELSGTTQCVNKDECALGEDNCDRLCIDTVGSYRCECPDEGTFLAADGRTCNDINECAENTDQCSHRCTNIYSGYECACPAGLTLSADKRTCVNNNCPWQCEQLCENVPGVGQSSRPRCNCEPGYTLVGATQCRDINECTEGISFCDMECVNTVGSYYCTCDEGWALEADTQTCVDLNECLSRATHDCQYICVNQPGGYICTCPDNYKIDPNNPTRCLTNTIQFQFVLDVPFEQFLGLLSLQHWAENVCDQINGQFRTTLLASTSTVGTFALTCRLRRGSVIVEFTMALDQTVLSDQEFAVLPVTVNNAIANMVINGSEVSATLGDDDLEVYAINEDTGAADFVPVMNDDVCGIWKQVGYCRNGASCIKGRDNLPYCQCADGYAGERCNVVIITPEEQDSGSLSGTDIILIAVFATLLAVLIFILVFFTMYRCCVYSGSSSYYYTGSRTSPSRYARSNEPLYTQRWWQNLPATAPAPVPGTVGPGGYYTSTRPHTRSQPSRPYAQTRRWQREHDESARGVEERTRSYEDPRYTTEQTERLSRWPAYRAYGIASRFTGSSDPGTRYSWASRVTYRY